MSKYYVYLNLHQIPARDEISRAATDLVKGVKDKDLSPEDIDEELVSQTLDLGVPELLIRTSGEVRLSDFMLWQVNTSKTMQGLTPGFRK